MQHYVFPCFSEIPEEDITKESLPYVFLEGLGFKMMKDAKDKTARPAVAFFPTFKNKCLRNATKEKNSDVFKKLLEDGV